VSFLKSHFQGRAKITNVDVSNVDDYDVDENAKEREKET
jgi:hypothetical protein